MITKEISNTIKELKNIPKATIITNRILITKNVEIPLMVTST